MNEMKIKKSSKPHTSLPNREPGGLSYTTSLGTKAGADSDAGSTSAGIGPYALYFSFLSRWHVSTGCVRRATTHQSTLPCVTTLPAQVHPLVSAPTPRSAPTP